MSRTHDMLDDMSQGKAREPKRRNGMLLAAALSIGAIVAGGYGVVAAMGESADEKVLDDSTLVVPIDGGGVSSQPSKSPSPEPTTPQPAEPVSPPESPAPVEAPSAPQPPAPAPQPPAPQPVVPPAPAPVSPSDDDDDDDYDDDDYDDDSDDDDD